MNTSEAAFAIGGLLAGGGMAAGGLAVRRAAREAVWKGYGATFSAFSLKITPPQQARAVLPAEPTLPVPAEAPAVQRSAHANDAWKTRQRNEHGQFLPAAPRRVALWAAATSPEAPDG